ncbi:MULTISPECIES: Arc family DNA-binding protein [unclassified Komagataeibacter]|uniref:Arc family DNA-binding protein n=1 Tax=unclassified Komagataeibacter TaxID=2642765 RepID=UPI00187B14B3|nr:MULTISPECIES: Arc family DNA-binding protein [unclassified Komagataeibacter]MBE7729425.1 Arc family DNA-binding protein [Komagataeibacter sp. FXV3]MCE2564171.1 Arc family DNA-binding protein [Komagataeibacter sp. FNDCF1]
MTDERRVPITLRMPRELLDRLKAAADARSHSMNAEIIQRLEQSLPINGPLSEISPDKLSQDESSLIELWRKMDSPHREAVLHVVIGLTRVSILKEKGILKE